MSLWDEIKESLRVEMQKKPKFGKIDALSYGQQKGLQLWNESWFGEQARKKEEEREKNPYLYKKPKSIWRKIPIQVWILIIAALFILIGWIMSKIPI